MKGDPPLQPGLSIVDRAIQIAVIAHCGQVDKAGQPYIHHPLRVLELVRRAGGNLVTQAAAVLHDVKEDNPLWRQGDMLLGALGGSDSDFRDRVDAMFVEHGREAPSRLPKAVVAMVDALTHQKGVSYRSYVQALANDGDLRLAKWADSTDNWARLHAIADEQKRITMHAKYEQNFSDLRETPEQKILRQNHATALAGVFR